MITRGLQRHPYEGIVDAAFERRHLFLTCRSRGWIRTPMRGCRHGRGRRLCTVPTSTAVITRALPRPQTVRSSLHSRQTYRRLRHPIEKVVRGANALGAIKALRRAASRCHWSRLSMMRSTTAKWNFSIARNRSSSIRNSFSSRRIVGTGSDVYCGPVLRHPAGLMLPAVDLGGRVWLDGRSCKGGPAAPAFGG